MLREHTTDVVNDGTTFMEDSRQDQTVMEVTNRFSQRSNTDQHETNSPQIQIENSFHDEFTDKIAFNTPTVE